MMSSNDANVDVVVDIVVVVFVAVVFEVLVAVVVVAVSEVVVEVIVVVEILHTLSLSSPYSPTGHFSTHVSPRRYVPAAHDVQFDPSGPARLAHGIGQLLHILSSSPYFPLGHVSQHTLSLSSR